MIISRSSYSTYYTSEGWAPVRTGACAGRGRRVRVRAADRAAADVGAGARRGAVDRRSQDGARGVERHAEGLCGYTRARCYSSLEFLVDIAFIETLHIEEIGEGK